MAQRKQKYCHYFHSGMTITLTCLFSYCYLNIYSDITFAANVRTTTELALSTVNCTNTFPDQRIVMSGIAGTDSLKLNS